MAAIKYERELLNYLQSCKKKPTTAGIWSAAIEFMEAKIAALANEIECRTRDQVSISPSMVVERLRQLSAVQ